MIRYISNGCKEQVVSEDQRFLEKSAVPTVLGQKESSDAHFTPKVADFATPSGHNFYENPQKFGCVLENP